MLEQNSFQFRISELFALIDSDYHHHPSQENTFQIKPLFQTYPTQFYYLTNCILLKTSEKEKASLGEMNPLNVQEALQLFEQKDEENNSIPTSMKTNHMLIIAVQGVDILLKYIKKTLYMGNTPNPQLIDFCEHLLQSRQVSLRSSECSCCALKANLRKQFKLI